MFDLALILLLNASILLLKVVKKFSKSAKNAHF